MGEPPLLPSAPIDRPLIRDQNPVYGRRGGSPREVRRHMGVEIRVLGHVGIVVDGQPVALSGSKQRAVLAMLALHANRTVSSDELVDGLWGEHPPASAAKNLQLYVSRLRKALSKNGSEATIVTHGRGYELRLPEGAVDATRFERLVEEAAREPASAAGANGAASAALELWRGAPLADVASEPFAGPEIGRLEELHLRAIELAIDAELAAGRHAEVIARLEELIAEEPLREHLHAQRMLALYRAGRQSEALEAYRTAREALIEQIGVEPGPELQRLQAAVLDHDPSLDAPPPILELPAQLDGGSPLLAGRERELRWLAKRWQDASAGRTRVALVYGPPGIGKTRLVAELAADVQGDGAAVLYASGGETPDAALATVARAGQGRRPTLLVLDNADDAPPPVLEAAAALAHEPEARPLLISVLHHDEQGAPAFAPLLESGAAQRLRLDPLSEDATAEIAELYAPREGAAMPLETLIAESEGVPLRIHRAAGGWAQAEAAERLAATAYRAAEDRTGLHTTQAAIAGGVVDLQTASELTRLYAVEEPPDPSEPEICPFRGLAPFDAAHAEYFFGRERLVAELVARLVGSTLLAVVGPSGSGKSSAVRAGLLPAMADGVVPGSERWRRAVMRPGERPLAELSRTLARAVPETGPEDAAPWIADALERLPAGGRLVLAVDQFEEAFVACRDETEREAFFDALVEGAADPDERLVVVLAIRADFYGRFAEHASLSTLVSANQILVGPMRRDELRRAIELPARRAGLRVEPRLVSALVGDVVGEPGGLPLLSAALLELWQHRSGRTLRHSDYERTGGVDGAVARLAEDAYQRLDADEERRARPMLLRLAGDDEEAEALVRRRVPLDELELEHDDHAARALAVLTESRLLTVDEGVVEVAHEALLSEWPRLRGWLEQDAEGRRLHHHLIGAAREWRDSGGDPAELYRGARLAAAHDWAVEHDPELNELEREFLDESRAASEREAERQRRTNRRLRGLLAGVGVLLSAAVVAGVIAMSERQSAQETATVADAERLGAEALNEERLGDALRLANAGVALDDSVTTRSNLLSTLLGTPAALGVLNVGVDPTSLALSPDGRTLAVAKRDGTVLLFDTESRELLGDHQAPGDVWSVAFDPQGDSVALAGGYGAELFEGYLAILDAETAQVRSETWLGHHPAAPGRGLQYFETAAYAPDGRSLVVTYSGGDVNRSLPLFMRRYDADSAAPLGKPVRVANRSVSTNPAMSPDGRLFASSDRATYAIDAETLRVVRRYPFGAFSSGISPDGGTLAIEDTDGGLRVLDLATGRMRTLAAPGGPDSHEGVGSFSPDGRTLATFGDDGIVNLWDVRRGVKIETLKGHSGEGSSQVFSPDGATLYTAGGDSTVMIWDVAGDRRLGSPFRTGLRPIPEDAFPPAFALSPDGGTLAVARLDGRVDLIDAETLRRIGGFKAFDDTIANAIEYSPDGGRLAVAGGRGLVGLWDAGSGERLGPLLDAPRRGPCADPSSLFRIPRCFEATVQNALAFSPDGLLAVAGVGGQLRIWDLGRREPIAPPVELPAFVIGLAFSPDGSQLAIPFGYNNPGPDGVAVLDVESGERITTLRTEAEVRSVAFSPDGELLASGQVDATAVLWATDGWQQVGGPLAVDHRFVLGVAFSPDSRTLATSNEDGAVALWDVESQEPIGPALPGPVDRWVTARFAPDGEHLYALYENGLAFRWEVDPAAWRSRACAITGGGLTPAQWEEIVPEQDYIEVCPR
jgi:WD40 repeat protein/DNA-binding SARP family transcriptional activator